MTRCESYAPRIVQCAIARPDPMTVDPMTVRDVVAVRDTLSPFNPANQYNPNVPFGLLDGVTSGRSKSR